jgi:ribonuclease P protein component
MAVGVEGDPADGKDQRFPREARITASAEIRALFRRGKRKRTRHLDVFVASSPAAFPRLGLVVPKPRQKKSKQAGRLRGPAVQRNRLKRRLREIGRTLLLPGLRERGCALDVLLRTRPEAYAAGFADLKEELRRLVEEICSRRP